jgi:hypothetical protein
MSMVAFIPVQLSSAWVVESFAENGTAGNVTYNNFSTREAGTRNETKLRRHRPARLEDLSCLDLSTGNAAQDAGGSE